MRKFLFYTVLIVLLVVSGLVYYKYYFVFGKGVKSGYLNFVVEKGYVFKTYEGKLIQEGLKTAKVGAGVQSNEFEFSVVGDNVYQQLQRNSGKFFDLHYKEYKGSLPWRGHSKYVVDSIMSIRENE